MSKNKRKEIENKILYHNSELKYYKNVLKNFDDNNHCKKCNKSKHLIKCYKNYLHHEFVYYCLEHFKELIDVNPLKINDFEKICYQKYIWE